MEIINKRRSIRSYSNQKVESEKIELIIRAAMQAPSARNQQPWHFVVIQNREVLDQIVNALPNASMFKEAPCGIVVVTDKEHLTAPLMAPQDASSATLNILLKATDLGLGTCWCGIYPNRERMSNLTEILQIPKEYEVFSLIAVGYPNDPNELRFIDRFDANRIHYEKF